MKTGALHRTGPARSGFTLAEITTAMAIFSLVTVAVLYSHLFGLRVFNICATRLSASQGSRSALSHLYEDVRSGKLVYVGNGSSAGFTNVPLNNPRQGNALQIFQSSATNQFVRYFMDPGTQSLRRYDSASGQLQVIAPFVTNLVAFSAEDYAGNSLTNDQNNRVIKLELDFYQWEFPVAQVGAYYDSYHLQTRISRRNIE
ncbi:MAG TPA: prepilin-type N-terminal cleavage/methylation domain-containing protein [Verrucomicrobiae bacterium]|nr:prepilin-type N-terminal cleavage/methylation domain-containing protein [Verrucomicrobiae bacterium]